MRSYTMVFVFDNELRHVLLLKKSKPKWQQGLYNAPGGQYEPCDATMNGCAVRELNEETRIIVGTKEITQSLMFNCLCDGSEHDIYVFGMQLPLDQLMNAKGLVDEPLAVFELSFLENNQHVLAGDCWHLLCITKTRLEQGK